MNWLDRILSWFTPKPVPRPAPVNPVVTPGLIAALNAERAKAGRVPRLVESPVLNVSALAWAQSMAANGVLTHGNLAGRIAAVLPGHAASEDIARGQRTIDEVVAGWMGSPYHRANILGPYRQVGHGEATDARGVTYWVVDFAS